MLQDSSETYRSRAESLKRALCAYLESANSVIYHTIHTDQVYLMIRDIAGRRFPSRFVCSCFSLVYSGGNWAAERQCPEIRLHSDPGDGVEADHGNYRNEAGRERDLISVRFSQRALFLPRDMFIICGHEMGHYVGKELRCRKGESSVFSRRLPITSWKGSFRRTMRILR